MDLPIKNGGSFHGYVSLPEGTWCFIPSGNQTWQLNTPKQMEVYSWERHRTKWWIFQQALFDYRRVVYGKSISYSWLYHSMPVASLCSHPSSFFSPLKLPFLGCARFRQTTIIRQISRDIPILAGFILPNYNIVAVKSPMIIDNPTKTLISVWLSLRSYHILPKMVCSHVILGLIQPKNCWFFTGSSLNPEIIVGYVHVSENGLWPPVK